MAIYVPTANNWHYVHFFVIGYITDVRNRVQPPIIEYVSYTHDHVQSIVRHVRQRDGPRVSGIRGIARDDRGSWLGGFMGRLGVVTTSCLTAELWAIHGGLTVAKNFNMKNVIIEMDSHEALMLMTKGGPIDNHPDRDVIEECRHLISELKISMMHTLREGNSYAVHLTKLERMQLDEYLVILHRPPYSMHQLLLADMAHVAYPRYRKHVR